MHKSYSTWNGLDVYPINDNVILLVYCIFNSERRQRRLEMQDILRIAVVLIKYENLNLSVKSK